MQRLSICAFYANFYQMDDKTRFFKSLRLPALFVSLLWVVKGSERFVHIDWNVFGTYPREAFGMIGILSSPFIHGDLSHLLSNTFPLLILGTLILYFYPDAARKVIPGIYLLTGVAVWLFASKVYHIGASGLVYGFAFFLFFSGVFRNDMKSLAISFFIIFMYGGIVWGLLPHLPGISWETHLFGAIAGSLFAYLFRHLDVPPREALSFENEAQPEISYRYIYVPKAPPAESALPEAGKPETDEQPNHESP